MSKKHFIALADMVRRQKPSMASKTGGPNDMYLDGRMAEWEIMRDALAEFCAQQNYTFKRKRWLAYINGECGPNGGSKP